MLDFYLLYRLKYLKMVIYSIMIQQIRCAYSLRGNFFHALRYEADILIRIDSLKQIEGPEQNFDNILYARFHFIIIDHIGEEKKQGAEEANSYAVCHSPTVAETLLVVCGCISAHNEVWHENSSNNQQ